MESIIILATTKHTIINHFSCFLYITLASRFVILRFFGQKNLYHAQKNQPKDRGFKSCSILLREIATILGDILLKITMIHCLCSCVLLQAEDATAQRTPHVALNLRA